MLNGIKLNHLKNGILALVENFDLQLLVKDSQALKTAVEKKYTDAENKAVFAHDSALMEAFGLSVEEGEEESSFQDVMKAHLEALQGNVTMLCDALGEAGIKLSADDLPEKAELVETLQDSISKKARGKLSKQGHGAPIGDKPAANAATGETGSLTEQMNAIKDPAERARFRSKNWAKLKKEAGL